MSYMIKIIKSYLVRILIGVSFFLFGFFVVAQCLELSLHDILVGLLAGGIGGVVMLVMAIAGSAELSPFLRARFSR
jgi:hypothetical protein